MRLPDFEPLPVPPVFQEADVGIPHIDSGDHQSFVNLIQRPLVLMKQW
jgi:hypothetical protein